MIPILLFFGLASLSNGQTVEALPGKPIKANASRITFDDEGLAYLNIKTKRKKADGSGWEENVHRVLFTGIAFWDEQSWRAEVGYKEGILDGEAVVVANNKILSRFRYEKGKKILD